MELRENGEAAVEILDIRGKAFLGAILAGQAGRSHRVSLESLPAGIYFLTVKGRGPAVTRKFVRSPPGPG